MNFELNFQQLSINDLMNDLPKILDNIHPETNELDLVSMDLTNEKDIYSLITFFCKLPSHLTAIHFRDPSPSGSYVMHLTHLTQAIPYLPKTVTTLDLSDYHLGDLSAKKLSILYMAIPQTVSVLNLSDNRLFSRSLRHFSNPEETLSCLPKTLIKLDLRDNNAQHLTYKRLNDLLRRLPKNLKILNFSNNSSFSYSSKELAQLFSSLPHSLTELTLSHSELQALTAIQLQSLLSGLPASVNHLDLSTNELYRKTGTELATVFSHLPNTLTSLSLRQNSLFQQKNDQLVEAFNALPETVTSLDLSQNNLNQKVDESLARTLLGLNYITTLNLAGNDLYKKTENELIQFLNPIANQLTSLDLRDNSLHEKTGQELAAIFARFSQLTSLNISHNHLEDKAETELIQALKGLPKTLKSLYLQPNSQYHQNSLELASASQALNHVSSSSLLRLINQDWDQTSSWELKGCLAQFSLNRYSLNLSHHRLHSRQSSELVEAFSAIPSLIKILNLSDNGLFHKEVRKLNWIFSAIPPSIQELILTHNQLGNLSIREFREAFNSLSQRFLSLDLRYNGFDSLSLTELNAYLDEMPDGFLQLTDHPLIRQQDGRIVPYRLDYPSCFKPTQRLLHQDQFASIQLVMTQWMQQHPKISLFILRNILSFLMPCSSPEQINRWAKQLTLPLFPSKAPEDSHDELYIRNSIDRDPNSENAYQAALARIADYQETVNLPRIAIMPADKSRLQSNSLYFSLNHHQDELHYTYIDPFSKTIRDGIEMAELQLKRPFKTPLTMSQLNPILLTILKIIVAKGQIPPFNTCLNLSRCGLNRLTGKRLKILLSQDLPYTVDSLNLRGNGLNDEDKIHDRFTGGVKRNQKRYYLH